MRVGIECEGIFSGTRTLFVYDMDNDVSDMIKEARENDCTNIYLGADNSDVIPEKILKLRAFWKHLITVEIPFETLSKFRKDSRYNNINFIVRFQAEIDDFGPLDQIKIESDRNCYLATKQSFIKNEKNYLDFLVQEK